ncbi:MAG: hypothetical protein GXY08_01595 [Ruminococcus sp.]|nr:hypothetical protein [Ruminococcus sp.]
MRHTILFTAIILIAIAVGLKLTSVTSSILSKNDNSNTIVERDDIKSDAVYITPTDYSNFDPFSIVEKDDAVPLTYRDDTHGKLLSSDIVEALFKFYSSYSHYTEFSRSADNDLQECMYIDNNGKIYVQKYAYYNNYGDLRYFDLITNYDFQIIFINFYDDTELKSDSSEIEEAVTNMESYLASLSDNISNFDVYSWISGLDIPFSAYSEDIDIEAEYGTPLTIELYDDDYDDRIEAKNALEKELDSLKDLIYSNADYKIPDPYSQFFRHLSLPLLINYAYPNPYYSPESDDEFELSLAYSYFLGASSAIFYLSDLNSYYSSSLQQSKFFVKDGRIYQAIRKDNLDVLTIIYNPVNRLPEGFLYDSENSIW